ncbi:MAG: hypothetical protein RLZZ536_1997 [Planctomycetota bacterium]
MENCSKNFGVMKMQSMTRLPEQPVAPWSASSGTASGRWSVPDVVESARSTVRPVAALRPLGLTVLMALSPLTAVADPWLMVSTAAGGQVMTWQEKRRRRLRPGEARRLALWAMEQAEAARRKAVAAEYELASLLETRK